MPKVLPSAEVPSIYPWGLSDLRADYSKSRLHRLVNNISGETVAVEVNIVSSVPVSPVKSIALMNELLDPTMTLEELSCMWVVSL